MKKNLLPDMVAMVLLDKEGNEAVINIKLFTFNDTAYIFMSDSNRYSASSIARHTATYISQIVERLDLDVSRALFFRHIYTSDSGSVFGQFYVSWENGQLTSYTFKMLSNLNQTQGIEEAIQKGEVVAFSNRQLKSIPVAV
ncbi:MAG: hypothetical protein P8Y45_03835 [Exilibacterium sp.]